MSFTIASYIQCPHNVVKLMIGIYRTTCLLYVYSYTRMLTHYPYVVLAVVAIVAASCLVVTFTIGTVPDFTDPRLVSAGAGAGAAGASLPHSCHAYVLSHSLLSSIINLSTSLLLLFAM